MFLRRIVCKTTLTLTRKKRYIVYAIATLALLVFPFIQINGNQLFLLSFDHKQLHLMGVVFDMQELYLMPFLLILMFVGIFLWTDAAGRIGVAGRVRRRFSAFYIGICCRQRFLVCERESQ